MGRASHFTTEDHNSPAFTVCGVDCGDLHFGDPGRLGSPACTGEDGSRFSSEANIENSFKPGDAAGWTPVDPADYFRCTQADANDPGSGYRRINRGVSGFHPGILWLVCFDGTKRCEGSGLGGD